MEARFVIYDVDEVVQILPAPESWTHAGPLNDVPTLTMKYSKMAVGGVVADTLLDAQYDVALELNYPGVGWFEPPRCRFVMTDDATDPTEESGMVEFTGVGVVEFDMTGVVGDDLSAAASYNADDARWVFENAQPGKILRAYLVGANADYHSIYPAFTNSTDSDQEPWENIYTNLAIEPTQNALNVLLALSDQGFLDWSSQGNTLRVYNPDTVLNRDLTVGADPVALMFGRECTDGPNRRSRRDFASDVVVMGDEGKIYKIANPNPIVSRRGRRAVPAQAGGISNETDATRAALSVFQTSGRLVREQMTRALSFVDPAFLPYAHYRPGDIVLAPGRTGQPEAARVRQITLEGKGSEVVGGSVVLNDRFLEERVRAARRLARLEGGGGKPLGGGTPTVPEAGKRRPAAPTGGSVEQLVYIDSNGMPQGLATFNWNPVTVDTEGVPIGIDHYMIRARRVS